MSTISTGQAWSLEGLSLTHRDPSCRMAARTRVKEHIVLAAKLGCPLITIGLLRGNGSTGKEEQCLQLLGDSMDECAQYAAEHDVRLMLEPINFGG